MVVQETRGRAWWAGVVVVILWYSVCMAGMLSTALENPGWFSLTMGGAVIVLIGCLGSRHLQRIMRQ